MAAAPPENQTGSIAEMDSPQSITGPKESPSPVGKWGEALANLEENLVEQRRSELLSSGENLTLLCCGEAGVGKTSLLKTLFNQQISYTTKDPPTEGLIAHHNELSFPSTDLKVRLIAIDTPGYGDTLNLEDSFGCVTDYIKRTFQRSLENERSPRRLRENYGGVDAILYFISPHRIKEVDLIFMKRLAPLATIVPIIAKADSYTLDELRAFRNLVYSRITVDGGIKLTTEPFAVVSGERTYSWGVATSENEEISDVPALRRYLLTDGLLDLHARRAVYYEQYKTRALAEENRGKSILCRLVKVSKMVVGLSLRTAVVVLACKTAINFAEDESTKEMAKGTGPGPRFLRLFVKSD